MARPCVTPGCDGLGYHPPSHPKAMKHCLPCLVKAKRERRHGGKTQGELKRELVPDDGGYQPPTQDALTGLKNPGFGL